MLCDNPILLGYSSLRELSRIIDAPTFADIRQQAIADQSSSHHPFSVLYAIEYLTLKLQARKPKYHAVPIRPTINPNVEHKALARLLAYIHFWLNPSLGTDLPVKGIDDDQITMSSTQLQPYGDRQNHLIADNNKLFNLMLRVMKRISDSREHIKLSGNTEENYTLQMALHWTGILQALDQYHFLTNSHRQAMIYGLSAIIRLHGFFVLTTLFCPGGDRYCVTRPAHAFSQENPDQITHLTGSTLKILLGSTTRLDQAQASSLWNMTQAAAKLAGLRVTPSLLPEIQQAMHNFSR